MRRLIGTAVWLQLAGIAPAGGMLLASEAEPILFEGRVLDPHGYPIPGAEVKALSSGRPVEARFTDDRGEFRVRLKPGRYSLRVRVPGFQIYAKTWLLGDEPQELLLRLEVDTATQHLEVRASAPRNAQRAGCREWQDRPSRESGPGPSSSGARPERLRSGEDPSTWNRTFGACRKTRSEPSWTGPGLLPPVPPGWTRT